MGTRMKDERRKDEGKERKGAKHAFFKFNLHFTALDSSDSDDTQ